jgi:hydroxymethylpyrimidine/phosphomethylpyrimidine kinase
VAKREAFIVLTVAGSDPTGGAGIQGDLKTFAAHGAYGTAVVAAVTAQNAEGVRAAVGVEPSLVVAQLEALFDQLQAPPRAAKTGMLFSPSIVEAVAGFLGRRRVPALVVDPVLSATAGGPLSLPGHAEALGERLFPLADVVTPNLEEAAVLLRRGPIPPDGVEEAAVALLGSGCRAVLLKGGHASGPATDVLATADGVRRFTLPRVATPHGHGSGCALSAAIAARLALGSSLEVAVEGAKAYVHRALAAARALGAGRGPVRHDVPADVVHRVVDPRGSER